MSSVLPASPTSSEPDKRGIDQLIEVMAALRDPERGCPWDLKQTMQSLTPYTIEEAYEVAAAIQEGNIEDIRGELGDLLFQVVFYARVADEQAWFDFDGIAAAMADKLIRRHPHVFGDEQVGDSEDVKVRWEAIKRAEREERARQSPPEEVNTVFADVPANLPAMLRAVKIQKRCASVGFDWPEATPVLDKIAEEVEEVRAELGAKHISQERVEEEIGDLLFAVVNFARHCHVNPERALQQANQKFMNRFKAVEVLVQQSPQGFAEHSLEDLELLWQQVKQREN
ncbi:MAG: nucleoside triphosphate pyrophosphohydrolase [Idiomarina sp.]|nr:nucleoside triphosphate pyrophosphohydrolase [Idiomarina sp.]